MPASCLYCFSLEFSNSSYRQYKKKTRRARIANSTANVDFMKLGHQQAQPRNVIHWIRQSFRFINLLAGVTAPAPGWSTALMTAMIALEIIAMMAGVFLALLTIFVLTKVCDKYDKHVILCIRSHQLCWEGNMQNEKTWLFRALLRVHGFIQTVNISALPTSSQLLSYCDRVYFKLFHFNHL